ncbi:MAG: TRAM domain-containing protein [Victivallaceae bacterium]|nr:TRAM domain-containing protein [Victivallaceae bacterium]
MKLNNNYRLEIEKISFGGAGLGRIDGKVCFVPRVLPGEIVEVEVKKEKPDYYTAKLLKVLEPSSLRMEEQCPYGKFCPGCAFQHADYRYESEIKNGQMRDFLERSLPLDNCEFGSWQAPEKAFGYRNKLVLHVEKDGSGTFLGYRYEDGRKVLDVEQCPLACDEINAKLAELRNDRGFFHTLHDGQTFTLRYTAHDGVVCWRNAPGSGLSWLKEDMPFGRFSVPAGSFHQVNGFGAAALVENVTALLRREDPEAVIDLYCGSGLFGVTAALAGVKKIFAIEIDRRAVESARYNLRLYGAENSEVIASDAGGALKKLAGKLPGSTVLIVDPPRGGLNQNTVKSIVRSEIGHLIYISCSPDTLGRDLNMFCNNGFDLKFARMINMFPRTSHFETFTCLTRK